MLGKLCSLAEKEYAQALPLCRVKIILNSFFIEFCAASVSATAHSLQFLSIATKAIRLYFDNVVRWISVCLSKPFIAALLLLLSSTSPNIWENQMKRCRFEALLGLLCDNYMSKVTTMHTHAQTILPIQQQKLDFDWAIVWQIISLNPKMQFFFGLAFSKSIEFTWD